MSSECIKRVLWNFELVRTTYMILVDADGNNDDDNDADDERAWYEIIKLRVSITRKMTINKRCKCRNEYPT